MTGNKVYLIGVGMGNPDTLTGAGQQAIRRCNTLIGAPRLLAPYEGDKPCLPLLLSQDIAKALTGDVTFPVGVLLSGDVGFYSGATTLATLLEGYDVERIPGISSLVYFCAKLGTTWQDAKLVSAHGRKHNAVGEVRTHKKTFLLTGGKATVQDLCQQLCHQGLGHVKVWVGEGLSYEEERITSGHAKELATQTFQSLAVMLVENPSPMDIHAVPAAIGDGDFLRGDAPMTKSEVRALAVAKLGLQLDDTVWDVGAGTGSVAIAAALAVPKGMVYAIEKNPKAFDLLQQNKEKFSTTNLVGVEGAAPDALRDLPTPDKVFLGGTGGGLKDILSVIFDKNPTCRIVLTAVTLETLALATTCFGEFGLKNVEITQLAVTKTKKVGGYHMMEGQNPIWMVCGEGAS